MTTWQGLWALMRPKHWIKNLIVAFPLAFSGDFSLAHLGPLLIAFFAFSLLASGIYVLNDYRDCDADRTHPRKCHRPLASGAVSQEAGLALMVGLFFGAAFLNRFLPNPLATYGFLGLYAAGNIYYNFGGKHQVIMDVVLLSAGYVWRLLYGAYATNVPVSGWLFLTVLAIAFYFGVGKRYGELKTYGSDYRQVLKSYSLDFLRDFMQLFLGLGIAFYALWAMEKEAGMGGPPLLWTVPLVLILGMRYSYLIHQGQDGDPVHVLLKDKALVGIGLVLMGLLMGMIYWPW